MDGHTQATGATAYPALVPSLTDLLHAAVGGVGGTERPGQVEMAQAVADAIDTKSHLLVQAGTGFCSQTLLLVSLDANGKPVWQLPFHGGVRNPALDIGAEGERGDATPPGCTCGPHAEVDPAHVVDVLA